MATDPVTPTELAKEWRVARLTIHTRIHEGAFPNAFQVGTAWRIPRADIRAYLDKQRRKLNTENSEV